MAAEHASRWPATASGAQADSDACGTQCIVITCFADGQPGYLDFSYRIKALATCYRVTVVSGAPLKQPELLFQAVEYVVLPAGEGRIEWLRYLWRCARLIRARRPACAVLLHSKAAPIAAMLGEIPAAVYWNEHPSHFAQTPPGLAPFRRALRFMIRWLAFEGARKAALVMPIGEAHYADLLARGCDKARVRMIYMGVDTSFVPAMPQPACDLAHGPIELIYAGTVSRERGRDVMLEAMKFVNHWTSVARLTIVGASPDELEYCLRYVRRHGLLDDVRLYGRVAGSAIPVLLSHADAGLCLWEDRPWWRFNPPTKLFEYLAAGLPVLASDIRTHTQYISDWHNGLIFNYDSRSLADAIRALWERRAELPLLKQRARVSGRQYLWDRLEPLFLKSIQEIARP